MDGPLSVELVHWPAEEARRSELEETSCPRLLMVEASEPAPVTVDPLEDWIRLPADERDMQVRLETLARRNSAAPTLDPNGVLRNGDRWVALPPIEASLTELLLEQFEKVVSREALVGKAWPGEQPKRNVLDVHVLRLRRRLEPIGLQVRTVRKRGYVLGH